ncbi:hypothetical protein L1049_012055 [Liquidambar formosana]|uniref:Ubiquitin thioesterase OTU n=1 Tax=Liquidambar formosana TaxID=63359 RepID=A0AAP0RXJ1_LIQFO
MAGDSPRAEGGGVLECRVGRAPGQVAAQVEFGLAALRRLRLPRAAGLPRRVPADGRCLFRAIAHGACLRSGEEAPDENRQRELADELRAQVVDELLKRREETEWFIEGDFDAYVKRIQQPYVWGGEPELLMASHVLKTAISVFMIDRSSDGLVNIANYGEEYRKDKESPINVLFHGYGHYDLVETFSEQCYQKIKS